MTTSSRSIATLPTHDAVKSFRGAAPPPLSCSRVLEFVPRPTCIELKLAYKPGSVEDSHSSRRHIAAALKQPTRKRREQRHRFPIWSCSRWGLPSHSRYRECGELLPRRFALTCAHVGHRRYIFCCVERLRQAPLPALSTCVAAIRPRIRETFHSLTASGN